jgi:spermidine synthase
VKNYMQKSCLAFGFLLSCISPLCAGQEWYTETLYDNWRQTFKVKKKLYEEKTGQQHLIIFRNDTYGKVLALDGVIQTTEGDEFVYHEMMTHPPLLAHGNAKNVLIIGGGDGGILREVLRHKTVEKATLVEIDASVVTFSKKHLPSLSKGAFDDPRARVVIEDGCKFVKDCTEKFDVIICDSTDPIGPGAVLFTSEFYGDCHKLLTKDGIFVNQNGVPFMQIGELSDTYKKRKEHFKDVGFYLGVIPTYVGGFMAFGWATDKHANREISIEELEKRLKEVDGEMKYYTPAIHRASFVLPKFVENALHTK